MRTYFEGEKQTPVIAEVDVVVVGGGTAGCTAAIAAAREGASVLMVERFGLLGGCPTVGGCFHIGNYIYSSAGTPFLGGLPVEIIERIMKNGGSHYTDIKTLAMGKVTPPVYFLLDPEVYNVTLMEMCAEANVDVLLNTLFCETVTEGNTATGVILQNDSGRIIVMAKRVVDCSGEGDVAASAGAPCISFNALDWLKTYGLLMRIGNVNEERFMDYFLSLPAGKSDPSFDEWLPKQVGIPINKLRRDWYWHHFLDPQPGGWGVPATNPDKTVYDENTLKWFRTRWESEGEFAYVGIHFFRDLIRKAVDNGDFEFNPKVDGIEIGYNFDGITGGKWRNGEVVINIVCPRPGFDAFDTEHITKMEIACRARALELARFFQKYMPGFENSYLVATANQTLQRHIRFIKPAEFTHEYLIMAKRHYNQAIFVTNTSLLGGMRQIPYRIMLPRKVENMLVAGKHTVGSIGVRAIPLIMAMGQGAGVAAAVSVKTKTSPRKIDGGVLREALLRQGVIVDIPGEEK